MPTASDYLGWISVKDPSYAGGAVGDGIADDTAAIQAALNFAYGPPDSPHGLTTTNNKVVYFPGGRYRTKSIPALTVLGIRGNPDPATRQGPVGPAATASIATSGVMTVTTPTSAEVNNLIIGTGVPADTHIIARISVNPDGTGTYQVAPNPGSSVSSTSMTFYREQIQLTLSSTSTLKNGYMINVSGVNPSYVNEFWGITIYDSTHINLYRNRGSLFQPSTPFVSGGVVTTSALHMAAVLSGNLVGGGRNVSTIFNDGTGGGGHVISVNGFGFGYVGRLSFVAGDGGIAFDYGWDGITVQNSQSCTFEDCAFIATGIDSIGLRVGASTMSSETTLRCCEFSASGKSVSGSRGFKIVNQNALMATFFGGTVHDCEIGLFFPPAGGSTGGMYGVRFQNNGTDVKIQVNSGDGYALSACRSEGSDAFFFQQAGSGCNLTACASDTSGTIFHSEAGSAGSISLDAGAFANGVMPTPDGLGGSLFVRGTYFGNPSAITTANWYNGAAFIRVVNNGPVNVADLYTNIGTPSSVGAWRGCSRVVKDCTVAATGNFGTKIDDGTHGGGTHTVPVVCRWVSGVSTSSVWEWAIG